MNNVLYHILYSVIIIITYVFIFIGLRYITKYRLKFSFSNIFVLCAFMTLCLVADSIKYMIIKNVLIIGSTILTIHFTSDLSIKDSFIAYFREFLMIIIGELIAGVIFGIILDLSDATGYSLLLIKFLSSLILLFLNICGLIIKRLIKREFKIEISLIFLTSILILLFAVGLLNFISTYNHYINIYLLFLVLLLFIGFFSYKIFIELRNNYYEKIRYNDLKSKNNEVIKYIEQFKAYNHNLKYNLLLIKKVGNKETDQIINKLLESNDEELYYIDNFKELPSSLIHIFSNILTLTNDNKINVIINNTLADKEIKINHNDYVALYEIIGNLLTNAVEAIPDKDGIVLINFHEDEQYQYVEIINNFTNDVDMDKIGALNYSTKDRDSGYGLHSVLNNKKIKVKANIINDLFNATVIISK